jgi:anti-sigma factor RsiW
MAVMMTKQDTTRAEISMLLPWYAAGTLNAADTRRVAAAISHDPELARRLEDIREEAAETRALNEAIPAPSRASADKFFAALEEETANNPRIYKPKFTLSSWLTEKMSEARPRTLAFAAAAAIAVIALQAGLIVGNVVDTRPGYQTATAPEAVAAGPQILANFAPTATVADIEALLNEVGGTIIEGPHAGGLYRIRIAEGTDQAGIDRAIATLRAKPEIVRFVAPAS